MAEFINENRDKYGNDLFKEFGDEEARKIKPETKQMLK